MDPVSVHVAHIRHLAKPSALEHFLSDRHGLGQEICRKLARQVAPFLEQALEFHDASMAAPLRVRPVFQYYSYLNLAVALVLIYQPTGWQEFRKHGVEDITQNLRSISLSSPLIRARRGAVTLFHSIISTQQLPKGRITLRDLLVPIPMVASELEHAFGLRSLFLSVRGQALIEGEGPSQAARSCFTFQLLDSSKPVGAPGKARFPLKRIYDAMPDLKTQYRAQQRQGHSRTFQSVQKWTPGNKERADKFHNEMAFKFFNYGGQEGNPNRGLHFGWRVWPNSQLLPTLTAGILLSFALSSLARYRANILDRVEGSKIHLLFEIFANEADGFLIPAMRNLLYAETLYVHRAELT